MRITHGLIGSKEWWNAVETGILPIETVAGAVSGFWPGQYRDGPAEFEILERNGTRSHWMCKLEPGVAEREYRLGRPVKLQYVHQRRKHPFEGKDDAMVTIAIHVG